MNIEITFRNMESSEATKRHTRAKVAKLQKFLRQPMTARVILSLDKLGSQKLRHVAEVRVASGGRRLEAKEESEDMYASVDKVIDKLERQIRGAKGAAQAKARRSGATLRGGNKPTPMAGPLPDEGPPRAGKSKSKRAPASKQRPRRKAAASDRPAAPARRASGGGGKTR